MEDRRGHDFGEGPCLDHDAASLADKQPRRDEALAMKMLGEGEGKDLRHNRTRDLWRVPGACTVPWKGRPMGMGVAVVAEAHFEHHEGQSWAAFWKAPLQSLISPLATGAPSCFGMPPPSPPDLAVHQHSGIGQGIH